MRSHKEVIAYLMALAVVSRVNMKHSIMSMRNPFEGWYLSNDQLSKEIDTILFDLARPKNFALQKRMEILPGSIR